MFSAQIITSYVAIAEAAGIDVNQSDENIAGGDATCFSWDEDVSNDITKGKMCFNDAGQLVLLESEEADGSKSSMRATEYSEDVSDSDFEPPYDVTDLPAVGTTRTSNAGPSCASARRARILYSPLRP